LQSVSDVLFVKLEKLIISVILVLEAL